MQNRESYSTFLKNLAKCLKTATGAILGSLGGGGGDLRSIRGDKHVMAGRPHAIESLCKITKKVIRQFLRIELLSEKLTDDGQLGITKGPLPFGWQS